MNRQEAHKLIDQLFDGRKEPVVIGFETPANEATEPATPERVLPEGKRAIRLKGGGDRVYYVVEDKKTRQWVTNPDVLDSLGFAMSDVGEVDETELNSYQMGPALYRRVDAAA